MGLVNKGRRGMCLIKVQIEDGPTREELDKSIKSGGKAYFKIEDEYYPHRITDSEALAGDKGLRLMGYTVTGLFIANYYFKTKKGWLITKYGIVTDDI